MAMLSMLIGYIAIRDSLSVLAWLPYRLYLIVSEKVHETLKSWKLTDASHMI